MAGNKTHEQQLRIIEHREGPNVPADSPVRRDGAEPASAGGFNQESRDHNKHNNAGQAGHKRQKHSPAEEKS
ncbi:MAG: hypothetical protein JWR08_327 [Enterovirga sp.]|nr:hypothetical protein [Enterovirga sp.]